MTAESNRSSGEEVAARFSDGTVEGIRRSLLEWFERHRRDLPWRGVEDSYAVWVAEIMLQQTRVATVVDYYERWMQRFPDVESVAAADIDEVLELWEGLGFYRRARYLHRSAKRVVDEYGGQLPASADELEGLTGIGPYTAGAIASIAFGEPTPVVDGNVARVLSRLRAISGDPNSTANENQYWALAEQLVDPARPGDFNEALMELGATVCTPRSPNCLLCPVREDCRAFERGEPEAYPDTASRATQKPVDVATCVLVGEDGGKDVAYVVKRDADGLLGGLWEFPTVELDESEAPPEVIDEYLGGELDLESFCDVPGEQVTELTHLFSHIRMSIDVRVRRAPGVAVEEIIDPSTSSQTRGWLPVDRLDEVAMSTAMRRVERAARAGSGTDSDRF